MSSMEGQNPNSTGPDSRNTTKRPYEGEDGDANTAPSLKRLRRPKKDEKRETFPTTETNGWNSGAISTIRTSLGGQKRGGQKKAFTQKKELSHFKEGQALAKKLQRLQKALSQEASNAVDSPKYEDIRQSVHLAEVDLAYNQYFPMTTKYYLPLFPKGTPAAESFKQPRPPLWTFVERWSENGQLQAFKDGKLDEELRKNGIILQRKDLHPDALRAIKHQEMQQPAASPETFEDPPESVDNHARFYIQKSPDPGLAAGEDDDNRTDSDDSGSEDGVILNVETNEEENEGMSETRPMVIDEDSDEGKYNPEQQFAADRTSEEVDPMVGYADASRMEVPPEPRSPQYQVVDHRASRPQTLAELDDADFDEQLRYFYITQNPQDLDIQSLSARCLVCAEAGHMAQDCPALTCADCGAYNAHFVPFCPRKTKCSKCRTQGHGSADCPSKLKLTASELICDLCQDSGHTEHQCELLWRTSGPAKAPDQSDKRWMYIYCYECGHANHFGNDCPTRKPGKAMGTGTWSMKGGTPSSNQPAQRATNGLSIRGRAQQQQQPETIDLDSDSEDASNFVRPRVPAPTRSGTIQISAPSQNKKNNKKKNKKSQPHPAPEPLGHGTTGARYYGNGAGYESYKGSTDSPYLQQSHPGTLSRPNNGYQPPPPPERTPYMANFPVRATRSNLLGKKGNGGGGESVRPMPSAASNAWRQRRT